MSTLQLDLFGEIEAAETYAQVMARPGVCPFCRQATPDQHYLRAHLWRHDDGICQAMHQALSHVVHSCHNVRTGEDGWWAAQHLDDDLARARELWDGRLDQLVAELARCEISIADLYRRPTAQFDTIPPSRRRWPL